MRGLDGRTIALLESRRGTELMALVQHAGGAAIAAVSVQECARPADIARFVEQLARERFDMVGFLTGAGVQAIAAEGTVAITSLGRTVLACRGPKPVAALRRVGLRPTICTARPHTSEEVVEAIAATSVDGRRIALVHYGELNPTVSRRLRALGAEVEDVCAYEWALPDDLAPLRRVVECIVTRRVDALIVTSQIQYRHLNEVARQEQHADALRDALASDVIVAAIGPVCADVIRQSGVIPDVMPSAPNLPSLVRALADYFDLVDGI
jgi:uroporphyrinogen-III synthase